MAWLERHGALREDVNHVLPGARSAICVALNYYQPVEREQRSMKAESGAGRFSIYVHGEDYHERPAPTTTGHGPSSRPV
jgi:epoxyqueuosine reductase QueG